MSSSSSSSFADPAQPFRLSAVLWRPSGMSDDEIRDLPLALQRLLSMPRADPQVPVVLQSLTECYSASPGFCHWAAVCERFWVELPCGMKRRRQDDEPDEWRFQQARRLNCEAMCLGDCA